MGNMNARAYPLIFIVNSLSSKQNRPFSAKRGYWVGNGTKLGLRMDRSPQGQQMANSG